CARGYYYEDVW
nr:immunoglobulin heavy chain junction region [Mus musculus]